MTHRETVTNNEYQQRVKELQEQGAAYFIVKVLKHNTGYELQYVLPEPVRQAELFTSD